MGKEQLQMTRCLLKANGELTPAGTPFKVQINPSELTIGRSVKYQELPARGPLRASPKFNHFADDTLNFSVILDGTGAVPKSPTGPSVTDVTTQVDDLIQTVYDCDGQQREPAYVQLIWGTLHFDGRLTSLSTQYTLFAPDGSPLRAKVTLAFKSFIAAHEAALKAAASSPDQARQIEVKEGDNLATLCGDVYGDPSYCEKVARANNLASFRDLKPGTVLSFPALR